MLGRAAAGSLYVPIEESKSAAPLGWSLLFPLSIAAIAMAASLRTPEPGEPSLSRRRCQEASRNGRNGLSVTMSSLPFQWQGHMFFSASSAEEVNYEQPRIDALNNAAIEGGYKANWSV